MEESKLFPKRQGDSIVYLWQKFLWNKFSTSLKYESQWAAQLSLYNQLPYSLPPTRKGHTTLKRKHLIKIPEVREHQKFGNTWQCLSQQKKFKSQRVSVFNFVATGATRECSSRAGYRSNEATEAGPDPRELTYETVVTRGCISLPSDLDCLIKHPGRTERSSSCYEALVKMSG